MGNKASTPNPYAAQCKYALNVPLCEYLAKEAGAAPDPTHNVEDDIYSGGALIQGMAERMGKECQVPATLADSPLTCVATGSGQALEEFEAIKRALKNSRTRRRF